MESVMDEKRKQYIRVLYGGKLGLSGDEWVDHVNFSDSLTVPYDAPREERIRVSRLKTLDLINRMKKGKKDLPWWRKGQLATLGIGHNFVQGFDNPAPLWESIKRGRFPNEEDIVGLLGAIRD